MDKTLTVTAAPGLSVPMQDKPRDYITDAMALAVPDTAYYRRRIADGDLLITTAKPAKSASGANAKASKPKAKTKARAASPAPAPAATPEITPSETPALEE
ncbi:DUF2635 domain-containing protein [Desulfovibrio sp. OttesenSCG-928-G15]|nr:DUF2635 domain-containing protein [Desulfovibrio sp. OttesenSCG-928-G15]